MEDCIFCKIAAGKIPASLVYEDDQIVVFKDLQPQAPVHLLMIPRKHIQSLNELSSEDQQLMGHLLLVSRQIAADQGIADDGWRLVTNINEGAGQSVPHIHFHLLGGRKLGWPPG